VKCLRRQSSTHSPVNHCRIHRKQDKGQTRYYLTEQKLFNSLHSLITYYRTHPLKSSNFSQILTEPIPQPDEHKNKPYDLTGLFLLSYHVYCVVTSEVSCHWGTWDTCLPDSIATVVNSLQNRVNSFTLHNFECKNWENRPSPCDTVHSDNNNAKGQRPAAIQ